MQWFFNQNKRRQSHLGSSISANPVSFLAVYSSTGTLAYNFKGGNTEYYMFKHAIILFFGLVLMYFAHLLNTPIIQESFRLPWISYSVASITDHT